MSCKIDSNLSMLILQCQQTSHENHEVDSIIGHCKLLNIEPEIKVISSEEQIKDALSGDEEFDFIYVSAHGNKDCFKGEIVEFSVDWNNFANILCASGSLKSNGILMLSCCRGGLNDIAYTLFHFCPNVQYVIGPRQDLDNCELGVAFVIFLFNLLARKLDPLQAASKVERGIETRLTCFDRLETETTTAFLKYVEDHFEQGDIEAFRVVVKEELHKYFDTLTKVDDTPPTVVNIPDEATGCDTCY